MSRVDGYDTNQEANQTALKRATLKDSGTRTGVDVNLLREDANLKSHDSGNSTSTLLGADETFTGDWIDSSGYVQAISTIITDQDSATNGLCFDVSDDGINILHSHCFSPEANAPNGHHYPTSLEARYYRVRFTNGATPQSSFKISTTLFKTPPEEGHVHPVNYSVDDDHPASIVKSILTGKKASGTYDNVTLTNGANLKVSVEEFETAVDPLRTDLEGGGYVTVGTAEVEITFTGTTNTIHLESKITNTGTIWIGKTGVTNSGGNAIASIQPGESIDIRYDDSSNPLYAISDTAGQSLLKGTLL